MTFILVIVVGLTLFAGGVIVGYTVGERDGTDKAYRAVDRHLSRRGSR